jgi:hypothetical protein
MTDQPLSPQEIEQILARAAEIDTQGRAFSLLRERAEQLQISPTALEQALKERVALDRVALERTPLAGERLVSEQVIIKQAEELTALAREVAQSSAPVVTSEAEISSWRRWITAAAVATGTSLGAMGGAQALQSGEIMELTIMGTAASAVALLWLHRKSRRFWPMNGQFVALWASFGYAFVAALPDHVQSGNMQELAFATGMIGTGISIATGTTLLWLTKRWKLRKQKRALKRLAAAEATVRAHQLSLLGVTATPVRKKKTGVRAIFARLTGSFHTPNPSH